MLVPLDEVMAVIRGGCGEREDSATVERMLAFGIGHCAVKIPIGPENQFGKRVRAIYSVETNQSRD